MKPTKHIFTLAVLSLFILPNVSFAYIDPGAGSMIIQVFIAAVVGALYAIKTYWYKLKSLFVSSKEQTNTNDSN